MNSRIDAMSAATPPLILMSDVDEIPSAAALAVLRHCEAPSPIHLQMNQYLYSFEWFVGRQSWRAAVVRWDEVGRTAGYGHGKKTETMLASAGVHCRCALSSRSVYFGSSLMLDSFCFMTLDDFRAKMTGTFTSNFSELGSQLCRGSTYLGFDMSRLFA
jgi:beta-1,4-mannosyl-glycoprotein beta-1,4-N-acetylglucosaminyltransferase